jgi:uncharacterized protein YaiI (UPF0178 family)
MKIWIDGDACPVLVKELVYKTGEKRQVVIVVVANSPMYIPRSPFISLVVVEKKFDEADKHIVDSSLSGDLVITADIPLASLLIDKRVLAMNPRGKVYTPENVKEELSMRNLREELRSGGMIQGGPPPFAPKDKERFANSFDRELTRLLREATAKSPLK